MELTGITLTSNCPQIMVSHWGASGAVISDDDANLLNKTCTRQKLTQLSPQ